jgi:putative FmdB family regulatory protein
MPTYGYRCPKGHELEAIHGMGAPPPTACQVRGAAPVSRVFCPISTSFTGTGFYSTHYGQGAQKPEGRAGAGRLGGAPWASGAVIGSVWLRFEYRLSAAAAGP